MKGILLASIIAVATNAVMANWSLVDESDDGSVIIYSDFTTIQITGDKIKMWSLGDFKAVKETNGVKFLSSKYQKEYDCKQLSTAMQLPFSAGSNPDSPPHTGRCTMHNVRMVSFAQSRFGESGQLAAVN